MKNKKARALTGAVAPGPRLAPRPQHITLREVVRRLVRGRRAGRCECGGGAFVALAVCEPEVGEEFVARAGEGLVGVLARPVIVVVCQANSPPRQRPCDRAKSAADFAADG